MIIFNPRQTVLVTCKGRINQFGKEVEKSDIFPTTWHSPINLSPPLYSISLHKESLAQKLIRQGRTFVINFMDHKHTENIILAGKHDSHFQDKFEKIGFKMEECSKILDSCKIKEAAGHLECEVIDEKDFGDHILFIGRVLHSEIKEREAKRPLHIDNDEYTTIK